MIQTFMPFMFDNDFAIKSKYYRNLCVLVLYSSYLEFTKCYFSEYVLFFSQEIVYWQRFLYTDHFYLFRKYI